jgi:hypothetical protein
MRSYFHSVFAPDDPSGGVVSQFWDGEDGDFHGSDDGFAAGVVSHAEAGVEFDLSHGEDWAELKDKGWLSPKAGTAFVSILAGCDTTGVLGTGADGVCGDTAMGFTDGVCTAEGPTTVSVPETTGFWGVGGTISRGSRCCANVTDVKPKMVTETTNTNGLSDFIARTRLTHRLRLSIGLGGWRHHVLRLIRRRFSPSIAQ